MECNLKENILKCIKKFRLNIKKDSSHVQIKLLYLCFNLKSLPPLESFERPPPHSIINSFYTPDPIVPTSSCQGLKLFI